MNPFRDEERAATEPARRRRGRPIRPLDPKYIPAAKGDRESSDKVHRVPAGGGYRILRQPRLLDCEE